MDDLRTQVAGLADLLGRTVARVDSIAAITGRNEERAMEARLAAGSLTGQARQGGVEVPDAIEFGAPIMSRLAADASLGGYIPGRIDPFAGRANMLLDPTLERLYSSVNLAGGGATTAVGPTWQAITTNTGAGSPSHSFGGNGGERIAGTSGRSSAGPSLFLSWTASTGSPVSGQVIFRPAQDTTPSGETPWLVASCRVTWDVDDIVAKAFTGTVRISIVNAANTEVATSDPVAIQEGAGEVDVLLSCAVSAPSGGHRPRVIFEATSPSIPALGRVIEFRVWELMLVESDTEDPPSFTPAIGSWAPGALRSIIDTATGVSVIETFDPDDGSSLFKMLSDGAMSWRSYDGTELLALDPVGDQGGRSLIPVCLDASMDSNSTTPTTWASFAVQSGRSYAIDLFLWYSVTSTAQGCQVGVRHPGGLAQGIVQTFGQGSPTGTTTETLSAAVAGTDVLTTVTATDGTTGRHIRFQVNYTCDTDGTFRLRFARGGSSSAPGVTIRLGSGGMVAASVM